MDHRQSFMDPLVRPVLKFVLANTRAKANLIKTAKSSEFGIIRDMHPPERLFSATESPRTRHVDILSRI